MGRDIEPPIAPPPGLSIAAIYIMNKPYIIITDVTSLNMLKYKTEVPMHKVQKLLTFEKYKPRYAKYKIFGHNQTSLGAT